MSGFWQLGAVANMPVNQQGQKQRTIRKTFAPQKRGRPSFSLNSPTAVNTPPAVLRDIYALLAPKPRAKRPRFRGVGVPVVVNPFVPPSVVYTDTLAVSLARSRRGRGYVRLPRPRVVLGPPVFGGTAIILVPKRLPRQTTSVLRPPEVTN